MKMYSARNEDAAGAKQARLGDPTVGREAIRAEPSLTSIEDLSVSVSDNLDRLETCLFNALGWPSAKPGTANEIDIHDDRILIVAQRLERVVMRISVLHERANARLNG